MILRISILSDATLMSDERPIRRVEEDLRTISRNLNTMIRDIQVVKSELTEIKEKLKEQDKVEKLSGGWWYY